MQRPAFSQSPKRVGSGPSRPPTSRGRAGAGSVAVVQVSEQEIMDSMLLANRHGHIACTQGGESLAGFRMALQEKLLAPKEVAVLDSTAHHLKFIGFQQMYFEDSFPPEFEVKAKPEYRNRPQLLTPRTEDPAQKTADLAGQIAASEVKGARSRHVITMLKHFIANNQTADIAPLRLFDIFLHQNMRVQTAESVNHAFRRLTRLRQHDANSLRAFNQLDHQRRTTDHVD